MLTIRQDAGLQTVISTFEVAPADSQALIDLLTEACNEFVRHQPGFVAVAVHVNDARTRVANYVQWQSREHFQEVQRSTEMQAYVRRFLELAKDYQPVLYDVVMVSD
ncbi:MAG TPA: antibiotic biosynthesis monooxygenase [Aliiroseovarius sp.]|nr:antibiotic biosynthesis monooxygenase [Aliiroseovarius sp.]